MHAYKLANPGALAVVAALVAAAPAAAATPSIAAPTVGELSAAWWQWALSIPAGVNPLNPVADRGGTGKFCGVGQHGDVWFLGGVMNTSDPVSRSCTIPAGTRILLAVINGECSKAEYPTFRSWDALRTCALTQLGGENTVTTKAKLNGKVLPVVDRQSPRFSITLPPENILGIADPTPNPSPAVAYGFWVFLGPLPLGSHTLEATGTLKAPDQTTLFKQEVTYNLKVVPPQFDPSAAVFQGVVPSGAIPQAVIGSP